MKFRIFSALFVFVFLCSVVSAQYDAVPGISEESSDYQRYKGCIDRCEQCEANCKNQLLESAAESNLDESFCMQITDETRKSFCLDNIYRSKAIVENDLSYCDQISVEDEKARCRLNVQVSKAVNNEDASYCDSLPADAVENCKSSFYNSMALQTGDKSYCEKLSGAMKENCISRVSPIQEQTEQSTLSTSIDYKKYGIYAGIGLAGVGLIVLLVFVIRKLFKGKKRKDVPLVVQNKQASQQGNAQQGSQQTNAQQPSQEQAK